MESQPQINLKMLNPAVNTCNSFSDLFSVYLKIFDHLIWNFDNLEAYSKF